MSTTEVSEVLGCLDFLLDVSVYGVTVPGALSLRLCLIPAGGQIYSSSVVYSNVALLSISFKSCF